MTTEIGAFAGGEVVCPPLLAELDKVLCSPNIFCRKDVGDWPEHDFRAAAAGCS